MRVHFDSVLSQRDARLSDVTKLTFLNCLLRVSNFTVSFVALKAAELFSKINFQTLLLLFLLAFLWLLSRVSVVCFVMCKDSETFQPIETI